MRRESSSPLADNEEKQRFLRTLLLRCAAGLGQANGRQIFNIFAWIEVVYLLSKRVSRTD